MVGPSPLTIATSSVNRLLKEEASYHKEQDQQEKRIQRLQEGNNDDENAEFQLKQEQRGLAETKAVFPEMRQRIRDATAKLRQQISEIGDEGQDDEVVKAKETLARAEAME